jgi:ABC-type transport system substrate-binding protein
MPDESCNLLSKPGYETDSSFNKFKEEDPMNKKLLNLLLVIMMLAVLAPTALAAPPAQEGQDYVVVADDWLSKLADKYLGNPLAYPAIVEYTNQKNAEDASYAKITNPDLIEVGWKIYIPSAAEAKAYTEAPAAAAGVCPQQGGTLVIAQGLSPRGLDNTAVDPGMEGIVILEQIMEGLLRYDEHSKVVPALAEEWSISEDGLVYNFKLRKGVKFHNGDEFTAKDVLYTFGRLLDPEGGFPGTRHRTYVDRVEAVNDYEVNIILKKPWPPYPVFLATYQACIQNQRCVEEAGDDYGYSVVCGTGPFKFKEWIRDDHLTMVRNEDYWQEGLPCVDEIIYRVITDPGIAKINLETGAVNALEDPPMELIADFEANPDIKVQSASDSAIFLISMSAGHPPFDDVRVRQAFSKALDRQEFADVIFAGYAEPAGGFFPSHFWAYDSSFKIPYDPDGAKALLAEAGYNENNPLKFRLHCYNTPPYTDIAQLIQAQMKKIGAEVEVLALDKATVIALARGEDGQPRPDIDAVLTRHIPYNVSDDFVANRYATWGAHDNMTRYNLVDGAQNPKAEELLKQVSVLSDYVEADRAKAKPLYRELERMVLGEDVAQILIVIQDNLDVVRSEVMDFPTSVDDEVPRYRVWLKE